MKNYSVLLLIVLLTSMFTFSCIMQSQDKKKHAIHSWKNSFSFIKSPFDTVKVNLNLDTLKDEIFVKSIKLSNNQELHFSESQHLHMQYFKIEFLDLNFDNFSDIRVLRESGATGNKWYDTWLYIPLEKKWVYNSFLSNSCSVSPDTSNKRIITHYTSGYAENSLGIYEAKDTIYIPSASLKSEIYKRKFLISLFNHSENKIVYRNTFNQQKDLYKIYDSIAVKKLK